MQSRPSLQLQVQLENKEGACHLEQAQLKAKRPLNCPPQLKVRTVKAYMG